LLDFRSAFAFKLILVALVLLLLPAGQAFAATINVDATCSLAQAINEANEATTDTGSCEAGGDDDSSASPPKDGHDTIVLSKSVLTPTADLPIITSKVTINGNNNNVSGLHTYSLFRIAASADVTINNLGIGNGKTAGNGGGIHVNGKLTLNFVTLIGNTAAAAGGGIYAENADLTIHRSNFRNNTAANGGGIYVSMGGNAATTGVYITNSMIFDNSAGTGGGIFLTGSNANAAGRLHYLTITRNSATGGDGGGIYNNARPLQVSRSIIYGNTGSDCKLANSPITQFQQNIIDPSSDAACKTSQITDDPLLAPPTNTQGHPHFRLYVGSPALNAANPSESNRENCWSNTVDYLGTARPVGTGCEYGAWEGEGIPLPVEIPAAPNASFTVSVDSGNVLRWNFDASGSSGSITSYAWTFGDGNAGTGQTSAHTYSSGGSYTVTLTATGPGGSDSATQSISVSQPVQAPAASFTYSLNGNQASFTSTSTGSNLSFSWDVNGDGAEDYSSNNPSHSYPDSSATYAVTLTVSNSAGSDSATQSIPVTQLLKAQSVAINALARRGSDDDSGPSGSSGSSGASSGSSDNSDSSDNRGIAVFRYSPAQTCQTLQPDIVVNNAGPGTACQRVNQPAGLGHPELVAAMPYATVDIWGEVLPNTQICFRAASGSIKFVDTAALPRTIADLPPFYHPGLLCASINAPGQVALVAGPPVPVPTAIPPVYQSLQYCMVRTQYILNFRASPGGAVIQPLIPYNVTLTAEARAEGWFKVDYHGQKGWLSADFVETIGLCD